MRDGIFNRDDNDLDIEEYVLAINEVRSPEKSYELEIDKKV